MTTLAKQNCRRNSAQSRVTAPPPTAPATPADPTPAPPSAQPAPRAAHLLPDLSTTHPIPPKNRVCHVAHPSPPASLTAPRNVPRGTAPSHVLRAAHPPTSPPVLVGIVPYVPRHTARNAGSPRPANTSGHATHPGGRFRRIGIPLCRAETKVQVALRGVRDRALATSKNFAASAGFPFIHWHLARSSGVRPPRQSPLPAASHAGRPTRRGTRTTRRTHAARASRGFTSDLPADLDQPAARTAGTPPAGKVAQVGRPIRVDLRRQHPQPVAGNVTSCSDSDAQRWLVADRGPAGGIPQCEHCWSSAPQATYLPSGVYAAVQVASGCYATSVVRRPTPRRARCTAGPAVAISLPLGEKQASRGVTRSAGHALTSSPAGISHTATVPRADGHQAIAGRRTPDAHHPRVVGNRQRSHERAVAKVPRGNVTRFTEAENTSRPSGEAARCHPESRSACQSTGSASGSSRVRRPSRPPPRRARRHRPRSNAASAGAPPSAARLNWPTPCPSPRPRGGYPVGVRNASRSSGENPTIQVVGHFSAGARGFKHQQFATRLGRADRGCAGREVHHPSPRRTEETSRPEKTRPP